MKILITGGAGFIGSNLTTYFSKRNKVIIFDSLEREGSRKNRQWLKNLGRGNNLQFVKGKIGDFALVRKLVTRVDCIFHLAAQVAVTTSIKNPRRDFEVNLLGTLNILEAARLSKNKPLIIYSSTNKVYGEIADSRIIERKTRYIDLKHPKGISENQPLDFYSPYACSKGGADSYVRDYSRIYNLPAVILRKSCIYGVRQVGTEDQGWVAYFIRKALAGEELTIYGDGKQVRDLLYIDDLVGLYEAIVSNFKKHKFIRPTAVAQVSQSYLSGVFNIGGGKKNTVSLLELLNKLEKIFNMKIKVKFVPSRVGDQKVYISNIFKLKKNFNWKPEIGVDEGLSRLVDWFKAK